MRQRLGWVVVTIALLPGWAAAAEPADPAAYQDIAPPAEPGEPGEPGDPSEIGEAIETAVQHYQDKVTVTTGVRAQKLSEIPMTLTLLSGADLEGTGQFTLCDTAQLFPGLECRRGAMRQATVSTRGLGFAFLSNRLLMLKDGWPENDPWTGGFLADETNPLTNVKQVEVVRGPGSSLYGSNAFAGVINIVTRGPDDLIKEGNKVGADGRILVGQNSTYRLQTTAAGKAGELKGLLNYFYAASAGSPQFTDVARGIVDTQQWSRVHQGTAKIEYKNFKIDAAYTDSLMARPGGNPNSPVGNCGRCHYTPSDSERLQQFNAMATANIPATSWLTFSAKAFTNLKRRVVRVENFIAQEIVPSTSLRWRGGGDVKTNLTVGPIDIIAGGDVKVDQVDTQNLLPGLTRADLFSTAYGVYGDAEFKLKRRLILGAGVRYDGIAMSANLWKNNTPSLSPRASAVFHVLPTLTARVNYGHAFRAPTKAELGVLQRMYGSTVIGNPYLKPEVLDTVEAALDAWPFGEVMRLTATGFYTAATNFISETAVSASNAGFTNIGGGRLAGVELEVASQVPKLNTSINVSYQFLYTRSDATQTAFVYAPAHRIQFRARTGVGGSVFIDLHGAYVGERFDPGHLTDAVGNSLGSIGLPGYFIASGSARWNIIEGISVSIGITNMFNTKYEETLGFPADGTQLFAEVKVQY